MGEQPGPLVMLLGCNTGVEYHVLASFASLFRQWAPVVIGTMGEVLAEEAQLVAGAVLRELVTASRRRRRTTVGEAIRNARRQLLAESHLSGLQLVLHGDAAWTLERRG